MPQMAEKRLKGFDCGKVIVFVKYKGRCKKLDVKYKVGIDIGLVMEECVLISN